MCLRMATSTIYKMLCENKCERLVFDNSSPTKWYLEIHNRKMTSTEAPMLQNNMNWEHVSLQNHSRHSVYRLHKPLLSVVFILTTIEYVYIYTYMYNCTRFRLVDPKNCSNVHEKLKPPFFRPFCI